LQVFFVNLLKFLHFVLSHFLYFPQFFCVFRKKYYNKEIYCNLRLSPFSDFIICFASSKSLLAEKASQSSRRARRETIQIRFFRRHVRRKKHCSACKRATCSPAADWACAVTGRKNLEKVALPSFSTALKAMKGRKIASPFLRELADGASQWKRRDGYCSRSRQPEQRSASAPRRAARSAPLTAKTLLEVYEGLLGNHRPKQGGIA
jgi:hypothetical protein